MRELERLSAGDCLFLDVESDVNAMYMSACLIFDSQPLMNSNHVLDWERILDWIEDRIARIPRYRQRLAELPLSRRPIWVDAANSDFRDHVRREKLAPRSDRGDLKRLCADFAAAPLDRSGPLWSVLAVEGFEPERFALVIKVHHSVADGIAGIQLAGHLLSTQPKPATQEFRYPVTPDPPDWSELLLVEIRDRVANARSLVGTVKRAISEPRSTATHAFEASSDLLEIFGSRLKPASNTPLDHVNTAERCFDWMKTDLARVSRIRKRRGGTLNDVVVATASLALGRFLETMGVSRAEQRKLDMRVAIPVNMREDAGRDPFGNRISMIFANVPVGETDALTVLDRTRESLAATKDSGLARAMGRLLDLAEWTPRSLTRRLTRWSMSAHPANLVLTNIHGPSQALYLMESELLEVYPIVPLMPGQTLAIAVLSYSGQLYWGFHADRGTIADLSEWTLDAADAFEELYTASSGDFASRLEPTAAPPHRPTCPPIMDAP